MLNLNIQQFGGRGASSSAYHFSKAQKNNIRTIEDGEFEGQVFKTKTITNEEGMTTGELNYVVSNEETMVRMIRVYDEFKRKGYATELLQDLQREVGDKDINFDMLTDDGKALIDKIGIITEEKKGSYGVSHYKGRIKLK